MITQLVKSGKHSDLPLKVLQWLLMRMTIQSPLGRNYCTVPPICTWHIKAHPQDMSYSGHKGSLQVQRDLSRETDESEAIPSSLRKRGGVPESHVKAVEVAILMKQEGISRRE
jgi:hypothetical protein